MDSLSTDICNDDFFWHGECETIFRIQLLVLLGTGNTIYSKGSTCKTPHSCPNGFPPAAHAEPHQLVCLLHELPRLCSCPLSLASAHNTSMCRTAVSEQDRREVPSTVVVFLPSCHGYPISPIFLDLDSQRRECGAKEIGIESGIVPPAISVRVRKDGAVNWRRWRRCKAVRSLYRR